MRTVNKVVLVGQVGRDPQSDPQRPGFVHFSVGTKDCDDLVSWYPVAVSGERAQYALERIGFKDYVYIEGHLERRATYSEIVAQEVVLLSTLG